jgi:hypothetical protein
VNTDQTQTYLAALASSLTINVIIPLGILIALFGFVWYVLARAQRSGEFKIQQMLLDDAGKASSSRLFGFIAVSVSSWYLAAKLWAGTSTATEFFYYLMAWSGAMVFNKIAEKWDGQMPWSK